jgi:hypothetical protein
LGDFLLWATVDFGRLFTLGGFLLWATFYFGRLFTSGDFLLWATVYFVHFFIITEVDQTSSHIFHGKSYVLVWTKNGLG